MSNREIKTTTNTEENSNFDITGYLMPAKSLFFVVVDEIGKDGFLVRKVYADIGSPHLEKLKLPYIQKLSETIPNKVGMTPRDIKSHASIADHVLANSVNTKYVSTSSAFPDGSPRFTGNKIYIDIDKAKKSGARLISTEEIIKSLEEYKKLHPHTKGKVEWLIRKVRDVDKEVLIDSKKVPQSAIFTPEGYRNASAIIRGARVVTVFGIAFTAYDLSTSLDESFEIKSAKPISAEIIRQAGGWGSGIVGFKMGTALGAAVGIATGPGALLSGLVGGIIFGSLGYFGFDSIADYIYENK